MDTNGKVIKFLRAKFPTFVPDNVHSSQVFFEDPPTVLQDVDFVYIDDRFVRNSVIVLLINLFLFSTSRIASKSQIGSAVFNVNWSLFALVGKMLQTSRTTHRSQEFVVTLLSRRL